MGNPVCPICGVEGLLASGSKSAKLLIIADKPDDESMEAGRPFAGASGKVLRHELSLVGMDLLEFRLMNLWIHEPNNNPDCFKVGYDLVLDEAKKKKFIILMGSETVKTFTQLDVSDTSGLQVDSSILSCPIVYAIVNPVIVFQARKGIGEVRLAIEKINARLKKEKLINA
jgi:hypothetical protein